MFYKYLLFDSQIYYNLFKYIYIMKSIVLTYCSGYSLKIYDRFAGSLFDTGYEGKIIFFIKNTDIPIIKNIKKKYIDKIEYIICNSQFHVQSNRYIHYKEYLENNKNIADYILICDSRDVLFQKNFDNYNLDKSYDLYVFAEDIIIKNDKISIEWINALNCNDKIYNNIITKKNICSGTTYGTYNGILEYLIKFTDKLSEYHDTHMFKTKPSDQGIHNYLVYTNNLNNIQILTNKNNLVNTIGMSIKKVNSNNKIVNINNDVSYIVHQYDRMSLDSLKKISYKYNFY